MGWGAGSLALSPFLQQMQLHAADRADQLPKRFVFVVKSNGLRPYGVQPQGHEDSPKPRGITKTTTTALDKLKLNKCMSELEPIKKYVNIIQGLSSKASGGDHDFKFGALGAHKSPSARAIKETIDGALAKFFPAAFPHLGFDLMPGKLITYPKISALGKDKNLPFYASPTLAYKNLFGIVATDSGISSQVDMEKTLLDFLKDDIKRVQKKLNQEEKQKLDHYLSGFESLSDRRVKMSKLPELKKYAPRFDDKFKSTVETHQIEAHFDMATAALIAGLTNVVTIHADNLGMRYFGLKHEYNVHAIGHMEDKGSTGSKLTPDSVEKGFSIGRKSRHDIREFHFKLIAKLAKKLMAIPEGDGNMLDNTLIVYLSKSGEKHHPRSREQFPFVTVGNVNGKLKTGNYLQYASYNESEHRTFANFYTSLLHAANKPRDHFGDQDPNLDPSIDQTGPLHELLASR